MISTKSRKVYLALCMARMTHLLLITPLVLGGCAAGGSAGGGGGGGSNPVPGIVALDSASVATGGPDFYMTVYGTGFVASSFVEWNGLKLPTTFVNSTQVFAVVSAANRSSSATIPVTVFNPAPGGGLSNAISVLVAPPLSPPPGVGVLQLVSAAPDGTPGNGATYTPPALSANGRYVAFQSDSTNLVPGAASGFTEIFVRDTCLGVTSACSPFTVRVSVADDGTLPNGNSRSPAISANGRYVAFDSSASNLIPGSINGINGRADVFLRDTCTGAPAACVPRLMNVSVATDGSQANDDARAATISAEGRFVAFNSVATNLVPNDTNGWLDIFLRDTCLGAVAGCTPSTTRVSVANDGSQSNVPTALPKISADGRYIAFVAAGNSNLVPNDPNAPGILHDTCFGAPAGCTPGNRDILIGYTGNPVSGIGDAVLSANARFYGISGLGNNYVPGDTVERGYAYVYDDCVGAPTACIPHMARVSVTYNGGEADSGSGAAVSSDDGNYVAFISIATNLLPYAYRSSAVYIRMTCANAPAGCVPTTYLLSVDSSTGIQGNSSYSDYPAITPDGRYVVFLSNAANWPSKLQSNGKNQIWLARVY